MINMIKYILQLYMIVFTHTGSYFQLFSRVWSFDHVYLLVHVDNIYKPFHTWPSSARKLLLDRFIPSEMYDQVGYNALIV